MSYTLRGNVKRNLHFFSLATLLRLADSPGIWAQPDCSHISSRSLWRLKLQTWRWAGYREETDFTANLKCSSGPWSFISVQWGPSGDHENEFMISKELQETFCSSLEYFSHLCLSAQCYSLKSLQVLCSPLPHTCTHTFLTQPRSISVKTLHAGKFQEKTRSGTKQRLQSP